MPAASAGRDVALKGSAKLRGPLFHDLGRDVTFLEVAFQARELFVS
jgi:hypothetical protein